MTNPMRLEVYKHLFASVAEEMGIALQRSAYSPNIKERRDFSCALFDAAGQMVSQAAHIPVHLGSMPLSVAAALERLGADIQPSDAILLNDPYRGGTHLPDLTLVSPVFSSGSPTPFGFVASRAHHADVGGMTPGSMPIAREIYQEGLIIPPIRLSREGQLDPDLMALILANVRTPAERRGDLLAQLAANHRGVQRLGEILQRYGEAEVTAYMIELLEYAGRLTRAMLQRTPTGRYRFADMLDDDGISNEPLPIVVEIHIENGAARVDFTGTAPQALGSLNAVRAITLSAVYYVFRCLLGIDVPNNSGGMRPIEVITPPGSLVDARHPAPVAGGNVETSQRIVDVLLGALSQAYPEVIPAASQGTMNNLTIGGFDPRRGAPFTYYETIAGGGGASRAAPGADAIHTHMTNTLNTPVEALETAYPLRVRRYAIRRGSGGAGLMRGGDGIIREIEILCPNARASLLTERRRHPPYGLAGGSSGACGVNLLLRGGETIPLPAKGEVELQQGDILSIQTPGGGGFGSESDYNYR